MTYYSVYKITNKINGKCYIGTHKTNDLNDGYMGSGKYLTRAIQKNGLENFEKVILHVYTTSEEMFAKEAEIVNEDFLSNENTYNLRLGGFGGFDYVNNDPECRRKNAKSISKSQFASTIMARNASCVPKHLLLRYTTLMKITKTTDLKI
jgi:hypothetical protein